MMDDMIYRQKAIDLIKSWSGGYDYIEIPTDAAIKSFALLPSAQPEITAEQVKEYCRKRDLVLMTSEVFYYLKQEYQRGKKDGYTQGFRDATVKSKDEDYRWNGGGNY